MSHPPQDRLLAEKTGQAVEKIFATSHRTLVEVQMASYQCCLAGVPARAHLSSIGLVSLSPIRHNMKFFTTTFPGGAKSAEMSYVLDALHEHFPGTIIILWDNLKGHIGLQAKYERQHPDWFHFERLPTYSPELNVVEQCWNHIKALRVTMLPERRNGQLRPKKSKASHRTSRTRNASNQRK